MTFGKQLKKLREDAGLSQPEFAERAAMSVAAIRNYEQGQRIPSWPAIVRIARVLKVSIDSFSACDEVAETPVAEDKPPRPRKK